MKPEDATHTLHRSLRAFAVAAVVAAGIGVMSCGGATDEVQAGERRSAATDHSRSATVDVGALWQSLSTLPSPEADNAIAALAPETRSRLGHLAEVIAAAHGWH